MKNIIKVILIFLFVVPAFAQTNRLLRENDLILSDSLYTDDLRFPVSTLRLPGSGPPSATAYYEGEVLAFLGNQDCKVNFEAQIPHNACDFSTDSTMYSDSIWAHIHCAYSLNGSNPDSVRLVFTWSWANIGDEFSAVTRKNVTLDVSSKQDSTHYMEGLAYIPSTGKRFSSQLIMSLMRDVSEDDYSGSLYLIEIDIHYLAKDIITESQ